MDDLKRRFISAETEEERNEIVKEISAAIEQNAEEVAAITLSQIKETNERAQDELVRNRLKSVLPAISLSYIAIVYFVYAPRPARRGAVFYNSLRISTSLLISSSMEARIFAAPSLPFSSL